MQSSVEGTVQASVRASDKSNHVSNKDRVVKREVAKSMSLDSNLHRVLVVDDDPDFLELLISEIGSIKDVIVEVAHGPAEALERLTHADYQLVVSDWSLEKSTGPEILIKADASIRQLQFRAKTPVIFISGSDKVGQTQVLRSLKHFEPVSFIRKSCGPPMISLMAERILHRFPLEETEDSTC